MKNPKFYLALLLLLSVNSLNSQWMYSSNGLDSTVSYGSIVSIGNKLFAGTTKGVYLSEDGVNWIHSSITRAITSMTSCNGIVYASVIDSGIYRSTNSGVNWIKTGSSVTFFDMTSSTNIVFASSRMAVRYTTDNGITWVLTPLIENYNVNISSLASSGVYLYAGCSGVVYKSSNNGINWVNVLNTGSLVVNSLEASGDKIFAGSLGVRSSTNNGASWINASLNNSYNYSFCIYENYIFSGTGQSGVFISSNIGISWKPINDGFPEYPTARALCISDNYIYAGISQKGIYRRLLSDLVSIQSISIEIPDQYSLSQNYPNPFNPSTKIKFQIPSEGGGHSFDSRLIIYDALGREIETLVNEQLNPGTYEVLWNASNHPSGVYFYKLTSGDFSQTKKMILIK